MRDSLEPIAEKQCRICTKTLPAASFSKNGSNPDGLVSACKECSRTARIALREERKEHFWERPLAVPAGKERICTQCRAVKPWSEFGKDSNTAYGIRGFCRECTKQKAKARVERIRLGSQGL